MSAGGGRFDFDDGGTYCGGWEDGKTHGHGVCHRNPKFANAEEKKMWPVAILLRENAKYGETGI